MRLAKDLRVASRLVLGRAVVRTLRTLGDPGALVLGSVPGSDPYPRYETIRAQGPIVRSRLGTYLTPSHQLCVKVLQDNHFGVLNSIELNPTVPDIRVYGTERLVNPLDDSFLCRNPPEHTRLRQLVSPVFAPRMLQKRIARVETIVQETVARIPRHQPFDLVNEFAAVVPIKVMCDLLGIPGEQQAHFTAWASALTTVLDGINTLNQIRKLRQALAELNRLFAALIAQRKREPGIDMISELLAVESTDDPLTSEELLGIAALLLLAGFENLINLIGNGALMLMANQDVKERMLADAQVGASVVDELLRLESPVQYVVRMANQPVMLADTWLPTNTRIVLMLAAANRDPEVFAHPNRFDIDRKNNRDHLAFSSGIHHCIAAGFARTEGMLALRGLFNELPTLKLVDVSLASGLPRKSSRIFWGVRQLPATT